MLFIANPKLKPCILNIILFSFTDIKLKFKLLQFILGSKSSSKFNCY